MSSLRAPHHLYPFAATTSSTPLLPYLLPPSTPLFLTRTSSWQRLQWGQRRRRQRLLQPPPMATYAPDELPVDEDFLSNYAPKEKESEEEARRRNWVERGWAPWEEILTPEGDFARKSINEGAEVPLQSPEALEAFRMLSPAYRRSKGLDGDAYTKWQIESQMARNPPDPLEPTLWDGPLALRTVPPRDWPPRGWEVDQEELAFIREAHKLEWERVDLEGEVRTDVDSACLDRYKVFLKQYKEWVAANRDELEEESYKVGLLSLSL